MLCELLRRQGVIPPLGITHPLPDFALLPSVSSAQGNLQMHLGQTLEEIGLDRRHLALVRSAAMTGKHQPLPRWPLLPLRLS
jgi:hypothetical protein